MRRSRISVSCVAGTGSSLPGSSLRQSQADLLHLGLISCDVVAIFKPGVVNSPSSVRQLLVVIASRLSLSLLCFYVCITCFLPVLAVGSTINSVVPLADSSWKSSFTQQTCLVWIPITLVLCAGPMLTACFAVRDKQIGLFPAAAHSDQQLLPITARPLTQVSCSHLRNTFLVNYLGSLH